uniref:TSA: Wollemia nobilis Ref_Wollemi_Transcript_13148_2529 transcribed RNA sequence n=1 Tax=Wollemia nobilis TaxID=56998 RepID=A0A0C9RKV7_9CONI
MGMSRILTKYLSSQKTEALRRLYSSSSAPIEKILIANRGEIACRVVRTARRLGIKTVAVYSDADRDALHVRAADEAVHIGPAAARASYLNGNAILDAARRTGAHAIHPGYGFLSESAPFAELCSSRGLTFIGPPAAAIRDMGDKSASKRIMGAAGVPLVPGYHGDEQDPEFLKSEAQRIGYPVLIKPTHGGGGKGMHIVARPEDFLDSLLGARREAAASFGNDAVLLEKYVARPRHVEVQIFGDTHGNAVHLYERDCSVQRRHQKIIEEAPAPNISEDQRRHLGEAAVSAAKAVGYCSAGTVEFIMDTVSGEFFFLEMNTRLQVEHPVTEMIIGQDLVEWQIRVANGEPLPLRQDQIFPAGHAFEARIYAENVPKGFLPAAGVLNRYCPPAASPQVRVETGVREGDAVSVHYDPMIAKLVVWGENRDAALVKLKDCLSDFRVAGVPTNVGFLQGLAGHRAFAAGQVETHFIQNFSGDLFSVKLAETELEAAKLGAALASACACLAEQGKRGSSSLWYAAPGFRINHELKRSFELKWKSLMIDMEWVPMNILVKYEKDGTYYVEIEGSGVPAMRVGGDVAGIGEEKVRLYVDGVSIDVSFAVYSKDYIEHKHVWYGSHHHHFTQDTQTSYESEEDLVGQDKGSEAATTNRVKGAVVAPMAGCIVKVLVEEGARVSKDQAVLVLEAMKMEHVVRAPREGCVRGLQVGIGQQVFDNSVLFVIDDK